MISFNEIAPTAEKAYKNGELYEFLTGKNGYNYPCPDAQVDVPTDWTRIIPHGIYVLYDKTKDENVIVQYQDAINQAINGTAQDLWSAAYVVFCQKENEQRNKSPFVLDTTHLSSNIYEAINKKRAELEQYYPYGKNDNNMYGDIMRLHHNFYNHWKLPLFF